MPTLCDGPEPAPLRVPETPDSAAPGIIAAAFFRLKASAVGPTAACGLAGTFGAPCDRVYPTLAAVDAALMIVAISATPISAMVFKPLYVNHFDGHVAHPLKHFTNAQVRSRL